MFSGVSSFALGPWTPSPSPSSTIYTCAQIPLNSFGDRSLAPPSPSPSPSFPSFSLHVHTGSDQQSGHIQFGSPANIFCIGEFLHIGMYCTSCIFIIVLSPNFPCLRWATHRSRDGVGFLGSQGCALCRQIVSRKDNLNPTGEARCPGARLVAQRY